ncbi:hypothetical protein MOJ79_06085 [Calidifontimicrobium sp. SYSU G02091]|uniref:hypothetical protein n=1 Tax=Calidifontimicrobium sp. SYSU G02091 TaxID=2926421 RepID=UPI001F53758C|nr:hypothetical protein [Calidifontimicrobium sp. SYSU G02091]MCI1191406.1 hypothetical protein [Calidifontimicrobium sp. SYSU G02091]
MAVELHFVGHLGNNLFQYALARVLAEELGLALQCRPARERPGFDAVERASGIVDRLDQWHHRFADVPLQRPGREIDHPQWRQVMGEQDGWHGHGVDLPFLLRSGRERRIVLRGYFQRTEYVHPWRDRVRRWYRLPPPAPAFAAGPQDVVIHVRQSLDMKLLGRALEPSFYVRALESMTPAPRTVHVCGLGLDDPALTAALAPWRPRRLDLDAVGTLAVLAHARRIVLANSTFSWWGAYLATEAQVVYPRPVRGYWSPDRPEVALEVPEDRYTVVEGVPVRRWQPLRWASAAAWRLDRPGHDLALRGPGGRGWRLPATLESPLRWLLANPGVPFGLDDLYEHGLDVAARRPLIEVLLALQKAGELTADDDALTWLARHYGIDAK